VTHVYDVLAPALGIGNALALLLLVVLLFLGPTRKFWVVLIYVSWELFATAALTLADLYLNGTAQLNGTASTAASRVYAVLYWSNDVTVDLLRFVLVIVLIYQVPVGSKPLLRRVLAGLLLVMMALPFLLFDFTPQPLPGVASFQSASRLLNFFASIILNHKSPRAAWFNSTSQLFNFGAAIMNVILWGALIQWKKRDPQVLAVSIGLGILVTGTAFSYGLRHFAPQGQSTAAINLFLNLTQLGAWLIWCRAFWPRPKGAGSAAAL
jgi:hypothetical protein